MGAINAMYVCIALAFLVLALLGYATKGPRYKFKLDLRHPIITTKRLLVGMGIRSAAWVLRFGQLLLDPLFEASADVGDWFSDRTSPEIRSRIRSRFI